MSIETEAIIYQIKSFLKQNEANWFNDADANEDGYIVNYEFSQYVIKNFHDWNGQESNQVDIINQFWQQFDTNVAASNIKDQNGKNTNLSNINAFDHTEQATLDAEISDTIVYNMTWPDIQNNPVYNDNNVNPETISPSATYTDDNGNTKTANIKLSLSTISSVVNIVNGNKIEINPNDAEEGTYNFTVFMSIDGVNVGYHTYSVRVISKNSSTGTGSSTVTGNSEYPDRTVAEINNAAIAIGNIDWPNTADDYIGTNHYDNMWTEFGMDTEGNIVFQQTAANNEEDTSTNDVTENYDNLVNKIIDKINNANSEALEALGGESTVKKLVQAAWIMTYSKYSASQSNDTEIFIREVLMNFKNIINSLKESDAADKLAIYTAHTSYADTGVTNDVAYYGTDSGDDISINSYTYSVTSSDGTTRYYTKTEVDKYSEMYEFVKKAGLTTGVCTFNDDGESVKVEDIIYFGEHLQTTKTSWYSSNGTITLPDAESNTKYQTAMSDVLYNLKLKYNTVDEDVITQLFRKAQSTALNACSTNSADIPYGTSNNDSRVEDGDNKNWSGKDTRSGDGGYIDMDQLVQITLYKFDKLLYNYLAQ